MLKIIFVVLTSMMLLACPSKDKSSGKSPFKASPDLQGKLEVTVIEDDQGQALSAEDELSKWRGECDNLTDHSSNPYYIKNARVDVRSDYVSVDPEESYSTAEYVEYRIEKIQDANNFVSINKYRYEENQQVGRYQHSAEKGSASSRLIEIISTSPPQLKKIIEDNIANEKNDDDDNTWWSCHGESSEYIPNKYEFASFTLKSGQKISGILETNQSNSTNYGCEFVSYNYKTGERKIIKAMQKMADKVTEVSQTFYSKDFVSPFERLCPTDQGIFHFRLVKGSDGRIFSLNKDEILKFSKP